MLYGSIHCKSTTVICSVLHLTLEVEVGMYIIIVLDVSHSVKRKTNNQTNCNRWRTCCGGLQWWCPHCGLWPIETRLDGVGFCIPIVVAALFMLRSVPAWITNTHTHNSSSSEAVAAAQRTIESPRPRDGASTSCVPMYVVPQKRVQRYEYLLRIGRFSGIAMHI